MKTVYSHPVVAGVSTGAGDLPVRRLREEMAAAMAAERPWPADLSGDLELLKPRQLAGLLMDLRVRDRLGPDGQALQPVIRKQLSGRSPGQGLSAPRLLRALRDRFAFLIAGLDRAARHRLMHVFQVHLQPAVLRSRMTRFYAVTYLPGRRLARFPDEERFTKLDYLTVATLVPTLDPDLPPEAAATRLDYDLKLHTIEVDADAGTARVGGGEPDGHSRCVLAKQFSHVPFAGADTRILSTDSEVLLEAGWAMHRALEDATVHAGNVRSFPDFPRVYLGFPDATAVFPNVDEAEAAATIALERDAFCVVDRWFRAGRPVTNPFPAVGMDEQVLAVLRGHVRSACRSWADVARQVGRENADFLLLCMRVAGTYTHDDLQLVPLDHFPLYSPRRPVRQSTQLYASLPGYLRGRSPCAAVVDGGPVGVVDAGLGGVQVIRFNSPDSLAGESAGIDYDFTAWPICRPAAS